MVLASVSASLEAPYADRHSEGSLRFDVQPSPMGALSPEGIVELSRLIERGLKESRAIDLEALCVQPGRRAWHVNVEACILDYGGNVAGALGLAVLAALRSFRRPDITIDPGVSGGLIVHSTYEREPVALTLHHQPIPITFAFFESPSAENTGRVMIAVDPTREEEAAAVGMLTVTVNSQDELCALQKTHGKGITPAQVMQCLRIAAQHVKDLTAALAKALEAHDINRVAARVRRHANILGNEVCMPRETSEIERESMEAGRRAHAVAAMEANVPLPLDVQRILDGAGAEDSVDDDEELEEGDVDSEGAGLAVNSVVDASAGAHPGGGAPLVTDSDKNGFSTKIKPQIPSVEGAEHKKIEKKGKRCRGQPRDEDPYAAIGDLIARARPDTDDMSDGLKGALKRQT